MRAAARLPAETSWQARRRATVDDRWRSGPISRRASWRHCAAEPDPLAAWAATRAASLAPVEALVRELRTAATPDLALLVVASRQLRQMLG
jgi:NAD-specific glutamate dehydrogenase